MRKLLLEKNATEDLEFWSKTDLKILKRTVELFLAILKDPFQGIGKPEPLRGELKGYWSCRITEAHRVVYTITTDAIIVISCRSHYKF
jgi:toxin YoeB